MTLPPGATVAGASNVAEPRPVNVIGTVTTGRSPIFELSPAAGRMATTAVRVARMSTNGPSLVWVSESAPSCVVNVCVRPSFGVGTPPTSAPPTESVQQYPSVRGQFAVVAASFADDDRRTRGMDEMGPDASRRGRCAVSQSLTESPR